MKFNISAPKFKRQRRTAAQRRGLTYEKKVLKALEDLIADPWVLYKKPWIRWKDRLLQPDAVIVGKKIIYLVEVKLTYRDDIWEKLWLLYAPPVETHFKKPVLCVQVFKNLRDGEPHDAEPLRDLLGSPGLHFVF